MVPSLSRLNLDLLYQFHQIASQQSLKKAARALHLTPPSVTHALAKLEAALGCTLCLRGRAGFRLTEPGRQLLAATEAIFSRLGETIAALHDDDDYSGIVNLGMLDGLPGGTIDAALQAMTQRYPACRLNLRICDPNEINRLLYQGELDAGISIFYKRLDALTYLPAETERLAYYISDRHALWSRRRIGKADLAGQIVAFLDAEKKDSFALETEVFGPHPGYRMTVGAYSNSVMGGLRILLTGQAVVPMPEKFMAHFIGGSRVTIRRLTVKTKAPHLLIECAYNPRLPLVPPVRLLLDRLATAATRLPAGVQFANR